MADKPSSSIETQDTALPDPANDATVASGRQAGIDSRLGPGETIGRHQILRTLGSGAMGVVYEARDPELGRTVAIKLLRRDRYGDDEAMVARLKREARALAQLAHPNVVGVHDVGVHDGAPFIAMEHVQGITLRAWLDAKPRTWREVLHVFEQAAKGLAAAHAAGLVHRDFKPDNVMIGDDGRLRVMDFGLARAEGAVERTDQQQRPAGHLDERMTASGAFIGTPAYMAPEQFSGDATDARTDQYAFMVALYEALFGKRPFTGPSVAELAIAVTEGTPAPPPTSVPRALRDIIMRGLAREPAGRNRDMLAVGVELARLQKRSPATWIATGTLAAGAIAAGVFAVTGRTSEPSACEVASRRIERYWDSDARAAITKQFRVTSPTGAASAQDAASVLDRYTRSWRMLSRETCEARGSLAADVLAQRQLCLDNRLRGVEALVALWRDAREPSLLAAAPSAAFALPSIADCASEVAGTVVPTLTNEQTAAIDRQRSRIAGARARLGSGLTDPALKELRAVADDASKLGVPMFETEAWLALGQAEASLGLVVDAGRSLEIARKHAERTNSRVALAETLIHQVGVSNLAGDLEASVTIAKSAESAVAAAGNPERLQLLLQRNRGQLYLARGELDLAAVELEGAHATAVELFGAESAEAAETERLIGQLAYQRDKDDDARKHWQHAIEVVQRVHGDRHPTIALVRTQLCNLDTRRDPETARKHCDAARTYYESVGGAHRAQLARVLWVTAELDPSPVTRLATLERARDVLRDTSGANSLEVASITADLARLHFNNRPANYLKAAEELTAQIASLERALGPGHSRIADRHSALGRALQLANKLTAAEAAFAKALAIREKLPAPDPEPLLTNLVELGNLRVTMGNDQGMALLERAVAFASQGAVEDPTGKNLGAALIFVGTQVAAQDNHDAALAYLERASAVKDPQMRLYAIAASASSYAVLGKRQQAERNMTLARRLVRSLPGDRPLVETNACYVAMQLKQWPLAHRTCVGALALFPEDGPVREMARSNVAECELALGKIKKARATFEEQAARDTAQLGAPAPYRGELMYLVARARRADGDEAGALAAADEAERVLEGLGLQGRRTLADLRRWRELPAAPAR